MIDLLICIWVMRLIFLGSFLFWMVLGVVSFEFVGVRVN